MDWEKLRSEYSEQKSKHYSIISRLEEPADREYQAKFTAKDGRLLGVISYRKLLHGEIGYILRLPFIGKLVTQQELTPDEQAKFDVLKGELVDIAVLPKSKPLWDTLKTDKKIVDALWVNIQYTSGMDSTFATQLDELTTDDFGFTYGAIALTLLHKTPSELALLPESDILFANLWFTKWAKRSQEK